MQVNSIGTANVSYKGQQEQRHRSSIVGSVLSNAFIGAGTGVGFAYIFKADAERFEKKGAEIIEKSKDNELKTALKDKNLGELLNLKYTKKLEETVGKDSNIIKSFDKVLKSYKHQQALRQAGIYGGIFGAIGLIFGIINKSIENKAIQRAKAQE